MTGLLEEHRAAVMAAATTRLAAMANAEVIKDRPAINLRDAIMRAVDEAIVLEDFRDVGALGTPPINPL